MPTPTNLTGRTPHHALKASYPPESPVSPLLHKPPSQGGYYTEKVDSFAPGTGQISMDQSNESIEVDFPYSQRNSMVIHHLGAATYKKDYPGGNVTNDKIRRLLPLAHPYWEFMRCRRLVNIKGYEPQGEAPTAPSTILGEAFPRPYYQRYGRMRFTAMYETLPWTFKTDAQIKEEYERYTQTWVIPGYQSIFIEGENFKFDERPQFPSSVSSGQVPAFPGGTNIPIQTAQVYVRWFDVPLKFVTGPGSSPLMYNILNTVGGINNEEFLGFPRWTLLCDVPDIQIRPNPIPLDTKGESEFLLQITFLFHYFDPKPWGTGVIAPTSSGRDGTIPSNQNPVAPSPLEARGHNMALSRFDFKWYPFSKANIQPGGNLKADNTTRLYPARNFKLLFRKPLASVTIV